MGGYLCRECGKRTADLLIEPYGEPTRYLPGWTYCTICLCISFVGNFDGNQEVRKIKDETTRQVPK